MKFIQSLFCCVSVALGLTSGVQAATIKDAGPYSMYAFDSINYSNASISTGIYAGESIILTNVSIATGVIPIGNTSLEVISGGTAVLTNGSVNGSVSYASTPSSSSSSLSAGATFSQAPSPFILSNEDAYFQALSNALAGLTANATYSQTGSTVILHPIDPNAAAGLFIFNLPTGITTANNLILDLPAGSTAIINYQGNGSFQNGGFQVLNGLSATDIFWNSPTATSVNVSGTALQGTILAPNATVDLENGSLTGQIIANSVFGGGAQLSFDPYEGALPADAPDVPSFAMTALGIVLAGFSVVLRRRRFQRA